MPATSKAAAAADVTNEVAELKLQLKKLQRDSKDQLALEKETQATFEHLSGQIAALRRSFGLLADVTMQEMDDLRQWVRRQNEEAGKRVEAAVAGCESVRKEMASMRSSLEVVTQELQTEQAARAALAEQLVRADEVLMEELQQSRRAQAAAVNGVLDDVAALGRHSDHHTQELRGGLSDLESAVLRLKLDIKKLHAQRADDLKVTEQALAKQSQQYQRNREGSDGGLHRLVSETGGLRARLEALDEVVASQRVDLHDTNQRLAMLQRDSSQRHQHLRGALSSFAEALGLSPDKVALGPPPDNDR